MKDASHEHPEPEESVLESETSTYHRAVLVSPFHEKTSCECELNSFEVGDPLLAYFKCSIIPYTKQQSQPSPEDMDSSSVKENQEKETIHQVPRTNFISQPAKILAK